MIFDGRNEETRRRGTRMRGREEILRKNRRKNRGNAGTRMREDEDKRKRGPRVGIQNHGGTGALDSLR